MTVSGSELEQRYRAYLELADCVQGGRPAATWSAHRDAVRYRRDGRDIVVDARTGQPVEAVLPGEFGRPRVVRPAARIGRRDILEVPSPDGAVAATEDGPDLALRWMTDGRRERLTDDGTDTDRWEVKGAAWSPDGLRLAARRLDVRGMDRFAVVHWLKSNAEVEYVPYAPVGGRTTREELFIITPLSRDVVRVDSGPEADKDLRPLGWRADSGEFYYLKTSRLHNPLTLMGADPETGRSRTIFEERADTFVSYWERGYQCYLSPAGDQHVWLSQRDGWAHLYLHDMQGKELVKFTSGQWAVTDLLGFDTATGYVYFHAHSDPARPYDVHVGRVRMDGTGLEQLTEAPGVHSAALSPSRRFFLDTCTSMTSPPVVSVRRCDGEKVATIAEPAIDAPAGIRWEPPAEFQVTAADGETSLHGQLYLPRDFDPDSRYPVIDSIYAGPNSAYVPTDMLSETAIRARALAELGFAVVIVDGRGTPERSKAFHDVVYRQFGRNEIPDHVAAIEQLSAARPYLDTSRVGVFGRSYGGYFAVRALLMAPETFHAGIAINPVYDLRDQGQGPVECCMGLLADNLEGYEFGSNSRLVGRLAGKLLLIHGTADMNAPFTATMKFCETLLRAGKQFDFLPVNEQPHHFTGIHGTYVNLAIARYFFRHLYGREL